MERQELEELMLYNKEILDVKKRGDDVNIIETILVYVNSIEGLLADYMF